MVLTSVGLGGMMGCAPGALVACASGLLRHTSTCYSHTLRRRSGTPMAAVAKPACSPEVDESPLVVKNLPDDDLAAELHALESSKHSMAAAMSPRELAALLLGPSKGAKRLTPEALAVMSGDFVLRVPTWALSGLVPAAAAAEGHRPDAAAVTSVFDQTSVLDMSMDPKQQPLPQQQQQQPVAGGLALPGQAKPTGFSRLSFVFQLRRSYTATAAPDVVPQEEAAATTDLVCVSDTPSTDTTIAEGKRGKKAKGKQGAKGNQPQEWQLHKAMAQQLAQDFLALANKHHGWLDFDRLVVSWNGNMGPDITIHGPASLLIELKVNWETQIKKAIHQVQGEGSSKNVQKVKPFLEEQVKDAGGLAVGAMLLSKGAPTAGASSKQRVRLVAWPKAATAEVAKLTKPAASLTQQPEVLTLEWDVDLDQVGCSMGAVTEPAQQKQQEEFTKQLEKLLAFIDQQEAVRLKQPQPLTTDNLPMLLALAHPWLVKHIGQPYLTGWIQDDSKLREEIRKHIEGLGLFPGKEDEEDLLEKVDEWRAKSFSELLHLIHGQQIWEAFCEVQAAIILMAEHGPALKWQPDGKEGTQQFQLEVVKGDETLLHLKGAAACFVQRFVHSAYTVDPADTANKEAVKQQIKQGLALLQFEQLQSKLGQVHTPMGVVKHACKEMVEPVLKKYLDQDPACKVVLLEPSAGTGMFTGELQQLAKKYPAGRVEVKAYELCPGQAAIANALGHTTTGGWNSLVGKALKRDTFTGGDAKTKLVVVGNPPYGRRGASVDLGAKFLLANHAVQADDIIYIIALNCLLPEKNKEALTGGVKKVPVPYGISSSKKGMAVLDTKPGGTSFDKQYELKDIIGCSNLEFSKIADDSDGGASPKEAAARRMMAPLLNLTYLKGNEKYVKRGSSLMLQGKEASSNSSGAGSSSGDGSSAISSSNDDSSNDSNGGGSTLSRSSSAISTSSSSSSAISSTSNSTKDSSSVSSGFNSALKGCFTEHAKKKIAWPTVLLHMRRRAGQPTDDNSFIKKLQNTPIHLERLPLPQQQQQQQQGQDGQQLQQQQGLEGLVPVHLHTEETPPKPLAITLHQLADWEMFKHRTSLLNTPSAQYGGKSKYDLFYDISRCGKGAHSTNDLANRSLVDPDAAAKAVKKPLAINSEEQLVDAAYQQAYRDALKPPTSSVGKSSISSTTSSSSSSTTSSSSSSTTTTTSSTSSSSGSSTSTACSVEEQEMDWTVLTGFLGNNQPLMDEHDIKRPFLQDVVLMYLAVGVKNHRWWEAKGKPASSQQKEQVSVDQGAKVEQQEDGHSSESSCLVSLLPEAVGGNGKVFTKDLLARFREHKGQLNISSSSSSSSHSGDGSSSSSGDGDPEAGAAGVLASSPDLMAQLPQLYQAFQSFWEYDGGNVATQVERRKQARQVIRAWLHQYLRRVVTAAVSGKP